MSSMTSSRPKVEILVVGPLYSNCYIIWDEKTKDGAVIDPGDDANVIRESVEKLNVKIKYILATHGHFDHVGAVAPLRRMLKAEFLAHKDDFFFIEDGENSARRWGINIEQPPKPDRFIEDGEKINIGNFYLEVIHTPGHSPGGISFLYDKMLFGGDTLFQGSIGRTDFRKGSLDEISNSIKKRLYTLPDDTIVYTGHGPITTIGDEKKYNAFVRA